MEAGQKEKIPEIQKLAFHLPYVSILGTNHCGKEHHETFKGQSKQHDILFRSDYAGRIVYSFSHHIQYAYYGGNWYASIEVSTLDHLNASNQEIS